MEIALCLSTDKMHSLKAPLKINKYILYVKNYLLINKEKRSMVRPTDGTMVRHHTDIQRGIETYQRVVMKNGRAVETMKSFIHMIKGYLKNEKDVIMKMFWGSFCAVFHVLKIQNTYNYDYYCLYA